VPTRPDPGERVDPPLDLSELIERLSRLGHEAWMDKRKADGWAFGPVQDGERRMTPLLVDYDALSETEKDTDRAVVKSTISGIRQLGWRLSPPETSPRAASTERCDPERLRTWREHLESGLAGIRTPLSEAGREFDMDDARAMEVASGAGLTRMAQTLANLATIIRPPWIVADRRAIRVRRQHLRIARLAIWLGTLAIISAILQLALRGTGAPSAAKAWMWVEVVAVLVASSSVVIGLVGRFHHRWIQARHLAERLRSLKFTALGWPEMWVDQDHWQRRVAEEVANLRGSEPDPREWANQDDASSPHRPDVPDHDPIEHAALATYYRIKRLEFQRRYFDAQAHDAEQSSWPARRHAPKIIFVGSVLAVLGHVGLEWTHAWAPEVGVPRSVAFEIWLVGAAALLPVLGFGLRAWLGAFEITRSGNLFRAKARALAHFITHDLDSDSLSVTMRNIAQCERFFLNEHREWCRLQVEAEWFL
jgi:hypothetical protein